MNEQIFSEFPQGFVEPFLEFCRAPAPGQTFIAGLEQELRERQTVLLDSSRPASAQPPSLRARFSSLFTRRDWRYAVVLLLAVLTIALFAIGPQRVLAQVQRWLGYVPGIGFVDLAETRVLASPIEVIHEGVRLRVEQVIAGPERTEVLISSPGLSEADLPWPNQAVGHPGFSAWLILPNGSRLEMTRWELNVGAGKLEFPPLPSEINYVTLLVPRLPLVPSGALPEDWEIPLMLQPANGELDQELFPQPYSPIDASDSRHGISLRVLDVAQTSAETAIHYQVEWTDPDWEFRYGLYAGRMPELHDDLGQVYYESPQSHGSSVAVIAIPSSEDSPTPPTPATPNYAGTLVFPPLSLSAGQATLWVNDLEFQIPAEGSFGLDLGDNPQVGDAWPLDISLEIAGFPVRLNGARLREETVEMGDGKTERRTILELNLDPPQERDGFRLSRFELSNPELGIYGSAGLSISNGMELYKGRLDFTTGKIPTEMFELQVTGATLLVHGPWQATWTIPGRDPFNAALPVRVFPKPDLGPGSEMQPVVEEIFLSDRLTAVELAVANLPPQAAFVQVLPHDPATYDPSHRTVELYLEDNWGRRYEVGRNQAIIRPAGDEAGYDPRWLFFSPLQPLARSLTLHVPGMEVLVPGKASFEVQVPQGLSFKPEEYTVTVVGGGGPERQETQVRWVSDPWPVDINVEIAGYRLHFTQAQVERDEQTDPPYRLILKSELLARDRKDQHLNGLRFSKIERPDGKTLRIDPALQNSGLLSYPYGGIGPVEPGSNQLQAVIILDVTDASRDELLSGRYRIEINGVTVWVPGPWELHFSLSGN